MMNDEHGDQLMKLLSKSKVKIDWKHVAITAKIDAPGNYYTLNPTQIVFLQYLIILTR